MTTENNVPNEATGGFRVADFTRYLPGPMASRLLADLGGRVIKIENTRGGDANRSSSPPIHGQGLFHVALNAGQRSLAIDPRSPDWPRVVQACARWADVVLVSGLPENLPRMGIDFDSMVRENPRLVHCNLTGYGERGPFRGLPAHGLNVDAFAGIVPLEWKDGIPYPQSSYQAAGAPLGGLFAALGVLAALRRRDASGEAQRVHVSLFGAAIWWNWRHVTSVANLGEPFRSYADYGGRFATYVTSDRKVILACPVERGFWELFCTILALPDEWKRRGSWEHGKTDHGSDYPWERAEIAKKIIEKPRDHWAHEFLTGKIPFASVLSVDEMLAGEQVAAINAMRTVDVQGHSARIPSLPISFEIGGAAGNPGAALSTPELGEHNVEILAELGLDLDLAPAPGRP